ncbi:MAG: 2-oxo acid dehydrogenase subunit E2 [Bacteroidales bacterium]|jgi:pyruvate/2-oxoglutarate dehydrogenase complex dihydrolipoamide acyltransferase (E2) component|nr:2-oxo acid dehydrogenase subunit E2 [Bacteroidales bacterium]
MKNKRSYIDREFPPSRLGTIDMCNIGKHKHYIAGMFELDVTGVRVNIREYNRSHTEKISFTSWLISRIARTIGIYEASGAYLSGKRKIRIFDSVDVSVLVEKMVAEQRVPIPLVVRNAEKISVSDIAYIIEKAKNEHITDSLVLQEKNGVIEKFYSLLPGVIRRSIWKYMLKHPDMAFSKMGNVAFTSIGMFGKTNGWFIPISVHPICFGVSPIVEKPVVHDGEITIGEILNMTVLFDHDVMDGADMARFADTLSTMIKDMSGNI